VVKRRDFFLFHGVAVLLGESFISIRRVNDRAGFAEVGGQNVPSRKPVPDWHLDDLSPSLNSEQHLYSEAATAVTVALVS